MNNFDNYDKIKSIDEAIKFYLKSNNIQYEKEEIHSWGYNKNEKRLTKESIYKNSKITFKEVISNELSKEAFDNITISFYDILDKSNFKKQIENKFVMEVSLKLFTETLPYNLIVTNIIPNKTLFEENELYSEVGKWYTGF